MHLPNFCILIFIFLSKTLASFYFGDQSINQYLSEFCASKTNQIVIINQPNLKQSNTLSAHQMLHFSHSKENQNSILKHLQSIHCYAEYEYVTNRTLSETLFHLSLLPKIKYKLPKIQIILDFQKLESFSSFSKEAFNFILSSLDFLYSKCLACLPFILLFSKATTVELTHLTNLVYRPLNINFKLTMISSNFQSENNLTDHYNDQVIHLNPTVDGCFQHRGVYVPKTLSDFKRLKVPYSSCNLHGTVQNVSVNDVIC